MGLTLIAPPAGEPVSLAELKEFLRVDIDDPSQDGVITGLGMAARNWAESFTGRRFVQQVWRLNLDFFPGTVDQKMVGPRISSPFISGANALLVGLRYAIVLPYPPVQSIVTFLYQAGNGSPVTLDPSAYDRDLQSNPARLTPLFGQSWPVARVTVNAVQVDYRSGYAMALVVTVAGTANDYTSVAAAGYSFLATDVGRPISIPQPNGAMLNTIVAQVDVNAGTATLRDTLSGPVDSVRALLVNAPNANPAHWETVKLAIKMLTARWFDIRVPDESTIPSSVQALLWPIRDIRL